jgi:hypothetical protein
VERTASTFNYEWDMILLPTPVPEHPRLERIVTPKVNTLG